MAVIINNNKDAFTDSMKNMMIHYIFFLLTELIHTVSRVSPYD